MRKKYLPVFIIILVTLLLIVAVMYWYNRKIETIDRRMREEPAMKIKASNGMTVQVKIKLRRNHPAAGYYYPHPGLGNSAQKDKATINRECKQTSFHHHQKALI